MRANWLGGKSKAQSSYPEHSSGTNHFMNAGKPNDASRLNEYSSGPTAKLGEEIMQGFARTAVPDADVAEVANAIVKVVDMAFGKRPFRVNAVCPGVVRTNLWQSMNADAREHLYESVGKSLLVGRVGEACDVARAYVFLMQEGYGTGQTLILDGGAALV